MKLAKSVLLAVLVLCLVALGGCSLMEETQASESAEGAQAPTGKYYEFEDVQVPVELELVKKNSLMFKVGTFKCGLLEFEGRVELESLINYFVEGMAKDNWTLKSAFKYPKVGLFFAKQGKVCVIHIFETTMSTTCQIWVAPAM